MTWAGAKAWARFYAKLVLFNAWNGVICWFATLVGVSGSNLALTAFGYPPAVDPHLIRWQGAGAALVGTILTFVGFALSRHLLKDPPEPEPDA